VQHRRTIRILAALAGSALVVGALVPVSAGASSRPRTNLVGTFRLTAGSCTGFHISGTYFRLLLPDESVSGGRYFSNPDSLCSNKTYTLVEPGRQRGLVTGSYQPGPAHPFTRQGDALASAIMRPVAFTGINFSVATSKKDPQTGVKVPFPSILDRSGRLSGQVEAWSANWNFLYLNQGSPKPGGRRPGQTRAVSGSYDAATRAFVLTWTSAVVGGPFNGFTGYWHLAGTFTPKR